MVPNVSNSKKLSIEYATPDKTRPWLLGSLYPIFFEVRYLNREFRNVSVFLTNSSSSMFSKIEAFLIIRGHGFLKQRLNLFWTDSRLGPISQNYSNQFKAAG